MWLSIVDYFVIFLDSARDSYRLRLIKSMNVDQNVFVSEANKANEKPTLIYTLWGINIRNQVELKKRSN